MSRLCAAALLAVSLGCASTGSLGKTQNYYADKGLLWYAVQDAIRRCLFRFLFTPFRALDCLPGCGLLGSRVVMPPGEYVRMTTA